MDDIDFNEVFADYFINEFDDPINAYTNSMANYTNINLNMMNTDASAGSAVLMGTSLGAQQPSGQTTPAIPLATVLPTGGIRTAFHSGVLPANKKLKLESSMPQVQLQQQQSQTHSDTAQSFHIQSHQQHEQEQQQPAHPQVSLPIGRGIRLGGIGGIAPATAQSAVRATGVPAQFVPWINTGSTGSSKSVDGSHEETTDHIVEERRQRNREHAKRSRVRKKFMLESLQEQVLKLQRENQALRMIVQEHIPEHAMQIISECCSKNPLFDNVAALALSHDGQDTMGQDLDRADFSLIKSLISGQQCFVLSDPKLPDNPIIFASEGFYNLTGYSRDEVLGRNCRFLQGPGTDEKAVEVVRKAIQTGSDATVLMLNYKSDGTPFWNQFFLAALRDQDNCIVNYVSNLIKT